MIRISAIGRETPTIEKNTCVRMGAVAVRTQCGNCGQSVVGIIQADRPDYAAIECNHCGNSADTRICDSSEV